MFLIGNLVLVALLASSSFATIPPSATDYYAEALVDARAAFTKWAEDNGKKYTSDLEETYRYLVWRKTLDGVVAWNTDSQRDFGYAKGMTWFADHTQQDFQSKALCSFPSPSNQTEASAALLNNGVSLRGESLSQAGNDTAPPPVSVDWRAAGVIGNVRNQQYCGACWAFGPVSAVESAIALRSPISGPPDLAEQELIDCTPGSKNDNGCEGNNEYYAYQTIIRRGGIGLEQDYPFTSGSSALDGDCRPMAKDSNRPFFTIDNFAYENSVAEETILQWVARQPVTVAVDATEWKDYRGGIYDGPCNSDSSAVNHVVTIVGYGENNQGVPYWLIRNSWGETWGEKGYIRLRRGVGGNGRCAVNSEISFPLFCGWNAVCGPGNRTADGAATTGEKPIIAIFPPLQAGLPRPTGHDNSAERKFRQGANGGKEPEVSVEYGEYESGIIAAF